MSMTATQVLKVLIIEDEAQIREIIQDILDLEGFETLTADNGEVGVRLAQQCNPNLVFCDLVMPKLGGLDVLAALADDPMTDSIPVVMLTALSEEISGQKAIDMGARDYLTKPFLRMDLLGAIQSHAVQ